MMAALTEAVGPAVATSIDGQLAWFDLRPVRSRLVQATSAAEVRRAGELILHGVTVSYDGDVSPNLDALGSQHHLVGSTAEITFTNPMDEARTIDVRTTWGSASGAELHVVGAGPTQTQALQNAASEVDFTLRLPANGSRTVRISLTGRGQPNGGVDFRVFADLRSLVFDEAEVRAVVTG